MKIALVAATGKIGRHIAQSALARGHRVTAIVRSDANLPIEIEGARIVIAPLHDTTALSAVVQGHDVLASAFGPPPGDYDAIGTTAKALVAAARAADVKRVLVVGGAGSLEVAPGVQLVDTPNFPAAYKPPALAHRAALAIYQAATDLDWTFFAPAAEIGPGKKRGRYRTQATRFLTDADGRSEISYADYADAFVEEIERSKYIKQVVTAAY